MRSGRVIFGVALIAFGLILSFVFPIMSIVPNMIVDYPPSQVQGDGATFSEGKYLYQEFTSDINLKFDRTTDGFWIGMWRDEGIVIPQGYGIVGRLKNTDPNIQDGDFSYACFNIDIDSIPTGNPGYVEVTRWIDDADYQHSALCDYLPGYHHTPMYLEFEIGKPYRISMWGVNALTEPQVREIPLPGVFWQWSTVAIDGAAGETSGPEGISFINDFSFGISSGTYEEVETDETPPIDDTTPPIDDAPVSVGAIFLGAIFLAFGVVILIDESGFFNQFAGGYVFYYVWASLIAIWIIVFTVVFYLSNNQTFWWEWLF